MLSPLGSGEDQRDAVPTALKILDTNPAERCGRILHIETLGRRRETAASGFGRCGINCAASTRPLAIAGDCWRLMARRLRAFGRLRFGESDGCLFDQISDSICWSGDPLSNCISPACGG